MDHPNLPLDDIEFRKILKQQQQAYNNPSASSSSNVKNQSSDINNQTNSKSKYLTVKRSGGGKTWNDPKLLEWDPSHFRLFVGNLSAEVTDDMLKSAFSAYPSLSKVRIITDSKSQLCKGYGFVAFKSPDDYFKAYKNVNGQYIGNHPCQLKRAQTEVKPVNRKSLKNTNHRTKPYNRSENRLENRSASKPESKSESKSENKSTNKQINNSINKS